MSGSPDAAGGEDRPPRFVFGEVVRIERTTGEERADFDDPVDVQALVGQEVVVQGAMPTDDQAAWTMSVWVDTADTTVRGFSEDVLESSGLIEIVQDDEVKRVPLDPAVDRWRDDLLFNLETDARTEAEAEAIAQTAAARLRETVPTEGVDWELMQWRDRPFDITLWLYPLGDALEAFDRIIGLAAQGWEHDEDESEFVSSRWTRSESEHVTFLAARIREADVTYRRWTSPRRRSRRSPPP